MGRTEGESVDREGNLYWCDSEKSLGEEDTILWGLRKNWGERGVVKRRGVGEEGDKRISIRNSSSLWRRMGE